MYLTITRKGLKSALAVTLAVLVGVWGLSLSRPAVATSAATGNWGLSFRQAGQPPVGNATVEELAAENAHYLGDTGQKRIYLTFDAGFENGHTAPILDALKKHQAPACFFLVGHYLESAPDLVKRMVAEGHLVGNHTYTHPDMSAIRDKTAFLGELSRVEEAYRTLIGQEMPKIYRPPQGKYAPENLRMAKAAGYHTFFWSLAYVDWYVDNQPTREQALDKLIPRIHPGAVVLLHSTSATNGKILDELLTKWEEMGYSFGSLTELCGG